MSGGGLLGGGGTNITANVTPTILAYLANNVSVTTTGSVDVEAVSQDAEGHAEGESSVVGGCGRGYSQCDRYFNPHGNRVCR